MRPEDIAAVCQDILLADGFDDCLIGWTDSWSGNGRPERAVYDARKCIEKLCAEGMSYEDASEYFSYNTEGAYVGKHTPIFVWTSVD